jgi:hypothetical protein
MSGSSISNNNLRCKICSKQPAQFAVMHFDAPECAHFAHGRYTRACSFLSYFFIMMTTTVTTTNLTISNRTQTSITLSWTDNANNEDGYDVLWRRPNRPWYTVANLSAHSGTGMMSVTHTGLQSNTQYCYQVEAYNAY